MMWSPFVTDDVKVVRLMIHLDHDLTDTGFTDAMQQGMSAAPNDGHQPHISTGFGSLMNAVMLLHRADVEVLLIFPLPSSKECAPSIISRRQSWRFDNTLLEREARGCARALQEGMHLFAAAAPSATAGSGGEESNANGAKRRASSEWQQGGPLATGGE
jgi:hypothetical protein